MDTSSSSRSSKIWRNLKKKYIYIYPKTFRKSQNTYLKVPARKTRIKQCALLLSHSKKIFVSFLSLYIYTSIDIYIFIHIIYAYQPLLRERERKSERGKRLALVWKNGGGNGFDEKNASKAYRDGALRFAKPLASQFLWSSLSSRSASAGNFACISCF